MKRDHESHNSPSHPDSHSQAPPAFGPSPPGILHWQPGPVPDPRLSRPYQPEISHPPQEPQNSRLAAQNAMKGNVVPYDSYNMPRHPLHAPPGRYAPYTQPLHDPRPARQSPTDSFTQAKEPTMLPQINSFGGPAAGVPYPGAAGSPQGHPHGYMYQPGIAGAAREYALTGDNKPLYAQMANGRPSSSEKPRVRVNKACQRCRMHKIKCTGVYPCGNCRKHATECKFRASISGDDADMGNCEPAASITTPSSDAPDISGPNLGETMGENVKRAKNGLTRPSFVSEQSFQRPSVSNPWSDDSSKSYTTYLEDRVRYLESVVAKTSFHSAQKPTSSYKLDDIVEIQKPMSAKWRVCRRNQGALAIALCTSLYNGLSPESRAQVEIPRTNYYGFNMSGCNYFKPEALPPLPDASILSREQRSFLIDFFFKEINPLFAILHEKVFREQWKAFIEILGEELSTSHTVLFSAMLSFVMALAIRFTEFMKPEGPSMEMLALEESLFTYAHKVIMIFSTEWESFELIQCWLLAALYLRIAHRQTSCHSAFGHALNMCRSMGLSRYEQMPNQCSPYEVLKAKRIFYAVYTFDRVMFLQGGRYSAISEFEINREFPSLDFEKECGKDDWMTLPAFAMLHIARLASYLDLVYSNEYDMITSEKMNREFDELRLWLDENGFHDGKDIFEPDSDHGMSSLVRSQVKFHFYDLIQSVHGKMLFSFFGYRVSIEGMKIAMLLDCSKDIIYLLNKVAECGGLYAPWYLTLQLILTVGVNSLVFINGGVHVTESRRLLKATSAILQTLRNSPVHDSRGKVIFQQRFKMAEECNWLFKMMSHIMALHYEESLKEIHKLGTDHGPSDVNMSTLQFEDAKVTAGGENGKSGTFNDTPKQNGWAAAESRDAISPHPAEYSVDQYLDNLTWFDRWLDSTHDL
ncbi:hypothetical protein OXX79_008437 [Metschnikowia pulcherrima]